MIRHLFALTWNRRRTNLLLMVEIFVTFMVLVLLVTWACWAWISYHQPFGYRVDDVWNVELKVDRAVQDVFRGPDPRWPERMQAIRDVVAGMPEVVAVAAMEEASPLSRGPRSSIAGRGYTFGRATDELPAVIDLEIRRGRWFGREDDGGGYRPVVITEPMARTHFGDGDPLGQDLVDDGEKDRQLPPMRVVGVARYREQGEFDKGRDFLFDRLRLTGAHEGRTVLLLRVRPGTPAAFEERLTRAVHAAGRDLLFGVSSYQARRQRRFDQLWTGVTIIGVLAGFLFLMVALGLCGVVWQNITLRTAEIGLRRAQGATAGDIQRQLLGELLAMATLPMALGALVVVNFATIFADMPLFDLRHVHGGVYVAGFAISALCVYGLVTVSALLPTRLATRVQPLQALRYE
jgi:putative ABC transport system permease protein